MGEKIYEYKGKHYCDVDLSETDNDYEGDLYDLYWELKEDGECEEETVYHLKNDGDGYIEYSTAEELIEEEFSDLVIS